MTVFFFLATVTVRLIVFGTRYRSVVVSVIPKYLTASPATSGSAVQSVRPSSVTPRWWTASWASVKIALAA